MILKGDLKGFQENFETFFKKYLSRSDTCQFEGTLKGLERKQNEKSRSGIKVHPSHR